MIICRKFDKTWFTGNARLKKTPKRVSLVENFLALQSHCQVIGPCGPYRSAVGAVQCALDKILRFTVRSGKSGPRAIPGLWSDTRAVRQRLFESFWRLTGYGKESTILLFVLLLAY